MRSGTCRVICDPHPCSGAVNMARDAALLQRADENPGHCVVRLYRWDQPTISLGYFQKQSPYPAGTPLANCPHVRRLTGGGAILHDQEWTYSCTIPRTHPLSETPLKLYEVAHEVILGVLLECGASAGFRADHPRPQPLDDRATSEDPFLCFLRSDPRDLAACGPTANHHPKITGSAQRRRRGTILQHGSVLLKASALLPQVVGISDLFPGFDLSKFEDTLPWRLANSIAETSIESDYTEAEHSLALQFQRDQLPGGAVITES